MHKVLYIYNLLIMVVLELIHLGKHNQLVLVILLRIPYVLVLLYYHHKFVVSFPFQFIHSLTVVQVGNFNIHKLFTFPLLLYFLLLAFKITFHFFHLFVLLLLIVLSYYLFSSSIFQLHRALLYNLLLT